MQEHSRSELTFQKNCQISWALNTATDHCNDKQTPERDKKFEWGWIIEEVCLYIYVYVCMSICVCVSLFLVTISRPLNTTHKLNGAGSSKRCVYIDIYVYMCVRVS